MLIKRVKLIKKQMSIDNKQELRKTITKLKADFSETKRIIASKVILEKVEALPVFQEAEVVMLYWSMFDEVFTHDFVLKWYNHKKILLPVVDGDNLRIKVFKGMNSMKIGEKFAIMEPTGKDYTDIENIDLIIIPGVAFDKMNRRLGRGKGYYDKLLKLTKAYKVGIGFQFQLFDKVPVEKHDKKMDMVITD